MNDTVFGHREDAAIVDLEEGGSSPDTHTLMGLTKGQVQRLGEILDALDQITARLDDPLTVAVDAPAANTWQYAAASGGITGTTAVTLAPAPAAGKRNYLESMQIINTDASVGTEVVIKDGAVIIWRGFAPASIALVTQPSMVQITFQPPLRQPSVGVALSAACITDSSQTYVNAQGFVAE